MVLSGSMNKTKQIRIKLSTIKKLKKDYAKRRNEEWAVWFGRAIDHLLWYKDWYKEIKK